VTLTIGKVASLFKITADTLRYYEREGLISPAAKSRGGYRLYDDGAIRRVRFIKQAQQCGFTLTEIRDLLTLRASNKARCRDVRRVALEKKLQLEAKLNAMKRMSKALDRLIAACGDGSRAVDDCPIVVALEKGHLR
jgi:MerR family Zn(II)-responsive transcriptional regulator of zntA